MALRPLQAQMPLGQFDGLDSEYLTIKGGEVLRFGSVVNTSVTDRGASDVFDGYSAPNLRPVLQLAKVSAVGTVGLADDGLQGSILGSVCGGVAGQLTVGATLGPVVQTASGKLTIWTQPGLYAISLDVLDATVQPTVAISPGTALYYNTSGFLCALANRVTSPGNGVAVATFVEFSTNGSLVSTPANLVGTLNTPDGTLSTTASRSYQWAVVYFNPPALT